MTPDEAADLAARTLAAIEAWEDRARITSAWAAADRERVQSDLAGLRECWNPTLTAYSGAMFGHARRYAAGLRRTAGLYGVTP